MNGDVVRRTFLDFFKQRAHLELPSAPLVSSDPGMTTLFTIAGMQQMTPYFLGREDPPAKRMVTVQKTVRTVDIEGVGDYSHLTFLEMLGNFSVGDYFKREAVEFTWELLVGALGIPRDRWWVTIYPGDEITRQAWLAVGVPADRIGETQENWWQPGPVGPCGTDSEVFYDRGEEYGCGQAMCRPETACCERFLEIWNNVFMEYFQNEAGERRDLPWKNIDTGMGLERLTMVLQGVTSVYDTDLFQPIISSVTEVSGVAYGTNSSTDRSLRIIADHCRAVTFIIGDGVMPSAEGRGYVLRRLLRRSALRGRLLGIDRPFLTAPVQAVIEIMGKHYSELTERRSRILQVVHDEERRFLQTLARGLTIFENLADNASRDSHSLSGNDAFMLYDTHGFPLELTTELAEERGLQVDRQGFEEALKQQQQRARETSLFARTTETPPETYASLASQVEPTVFTGYEELQRTTEIAGLIAGGHLVPRAEAGDTLEIVLAATPFYAESGGQVGDEGVVRSDGGVARVLDTRRPHSGLIVHKAEVVQGTFSVGDVVDAEVDAERRLHTLPHHSGTHLLHKALQEVLGPEATQAGSLVAPDRLRFDFRWPRPVTKDELRDVQDRVNAAIWANLPVRTTIMSYEEATQRGAMALFGEKYGDRVRVVSMGNWSKELCGGTHVTATGDIGLLVIISETGIGSGIRRIEALAGAAAYAYVNDLREHVSSVSEILQTSTENLPSRARQVMMDLRTYEKRIEALTVQLAKREAQFLLQGGVSVGNLLVVAAQIAAESQSMLKATVDAVREGLDRGIVILAAEIDGKPSFAVAVTRNLTGEGFSANVILRQAAREAGGGGGGNAEFAQGGGRDASKIPAVIEAALALIRQKAED